MAHQLDIRIHAIPAVLIFLTAHRCFASVPARPNILFIYTDDQARWSVGAYGNRDCVTPTMDRLAREGMLFTQAYKVTSTGFSSKQATLLAARRPPGSSVRPGCSLGANSASKDP